jgi:hypothetical protein
MANALANNSDKDLPRIIDNASGDVLPTRGKKIDLATINDVRLEMASVYRGMRSGKIETSDGTKLAYVLSAIGKMIESHDIEMRIEALENSTANKQRDHASSIR